MSNHFDDNHDTLRVLKLMPELLTRVSIAPQPVTEEHRKRILKPEDAEVVVFVDTQPPHVYISEQTIKPVFQAYV